MDICIECYTTQLTCIRNLDHVPRDNIHAYGIVSQWVMVGTEFGFIITWRNVALCNQTNPPPPPPHKISAYNYHGGLKAEFYRLQDAHI